MESAAESGLTVTDISATSECGCGGCGCGESASTNREEATADGNTVREEYFVTGMTCGHCVSSVTEELSELAGVANVTVTLRAGGTSVVTVESSSVLDADAVRAAVEEAGYTLMTATP